MVEGRTLARGARAVGALVSVVLAVINLAWIIRDLREAHRATDLWWTWTGTPYRVPDGTIFGSSLADLSLLVVSLVVAVVAVRSSAGAGALAALGFSTIAWRLPTIWVLGGDWMQGLPHHLRTLGTASAWASVGLGVVLLLTVAAGRRPVGEAGASYDAPASTASSGVPAAATPLSSGVGDGRTSAADLPAPRPATGGAVVGALFLAVAGCVLAAWQVHWLHAYHWDAYRQLLTGEHTVLTLRATPTAWSGWALVALALFAAVSAVARTPYSRPWGMIAAALLLFVGASDTSWAVKAKEVQHFGDLHTTAKLSVATSFFEVLVGVVVLVALAGYEEPAVPVDPAGNPDRAEPGVEGPPHDPGSSPYGQDGSPYGGGGGYGSPPAPAPGGYGQPAGGPQPPAAPTGQGGFGRPGGPGGRGSPGGYGAPGGYGPPGGPGGYGPRRPGGGPADPRNPGGGGGFGPPGGGQPPAQPPGYGPPSGR